MNVQCETGVESNVANLSHSFRIAECSSLLSNACHFIRQRKKRREEKKPFWQNQITFNFTCLLSLHGRLLLYYCYHWCKMLYYIMVFRCFVSLSWTGQQKSTGNMPRCFCSLQRSKLVKDTDIHIGSCLYCTDRTRQIAFWQVSWESWQAEMKKHTNTHLHWMLSLSYTLPIVSQCCFVIAEDKGERDSNLSFFKRCTLCTLYDISIQRKRQCCKIKFLILWNNNQATVSIFCPSLWHLDSPFLL